MSFSNCTYTREFFGSSDRDPAIFPAVEGDGDYAFHGRTALCKARPLNSLSGASIMLRIVAGLKSGYHAGVFTSPGSSGELELTRIGGSLATWEDALTVCKIALEKIEELPKRRSWSKADVELVLTKDVR